jgi:hypothetical protein
MNCFPPNFRFRHAWRPYQQRVLDEFDRHLADRHCHIAAAPGAGKTVLGLEAIRRLGVPALVLAPTAAIRDQWLLRLREAFLPDGAIADWSSDALEAPGLLTVSTYQALHAALRRLGLPVLHGRLAAAGIGCLVLDEAHHLRNQWWQGLVALKRELAAPWLIALTGTPPYDVPQQEWNRYIALCGPLDAEVAVPELVRAGTLCPHQDFVYFTTPAPEERDALQRFQRGVRPLPTELALDRGFIDLLAGHPLVREPDAHLEQLVQRSDYVLCIAMLLREAAPERCTALLARLGLAGVRLPALGIDAAERLLNGLLFGRDPLLGADAEVLQRLTRRLRELGAVEQRQVHLRAPPHLLRLLEASRSKCDSVAAIIELEAREAPLQLRAVVLCDQIREADFPRPGEGPPRFPHIGVVPVFERLRQLQLPGVRLAVLTGSVVVVPAPVLAALQAAVAARGLDPARLRAAPLWHAGGFVRIDNDAACGAVLLAAMTALFGRGDVNVMVGTAALLGEGWDAPALNTLVLASAVRSGMGSNQMRGRALRVDPAAPYKCANIWHLACLDGDAGADPPGGIDLARLAQRFRGFAGIGFGEAVIENGIERLGLDTGALQRAGCDALNARMCGLAVDREAIRRRWSALLEDRSARPRRMLTETRVPQRRLVAVAVWRHALPWHRLPLLRWLHERRLQQRLLRIAIALLQALRGAGQVGAERARVEVGIGATAVRCRLHGGSAHEESLFAQALREMFDFPQAPRYLLRRGGECWVVPTCLGINQRLATALQVGLDAATGATELVYTRTEAGQLALLQARERWLAGRFGEGCESRTRWA